MNMYLQCAVYISVGGMVGALYGAALREPAPADTGPVDVEVVVDATAIAVHEDVVTPVPETSPVPTTVPVQATSPPTSTSVPTATLEPTPTPEPATPQPTEVVRAQSVSALPATKPAMSKPAVVGLPLEEEVPIEEPEAGAPETTTSPTLSQEPAPTPTASPITTATPTMNATFTAMPTSVATLSVTAATPSPTITLLATTRPTVPPPSRNPAVSPVPQPPSPLPVPTEGPALTATATLASTPAVLPTPTPCGNQGINCREP